LNNSDDGHGKGQSDWKLKSLERQISMQIHSSKAKTIDINLEVEIQKIPGESNHWKEICSTKIMQDLTYPRVANGKIRACS